MIGENGTGKTTLLKSIYKLMNLDNACKSDDKLYLTMDEEEVSYFESANDLNDISQNGKITLYNIDGIYNIEYN